MATKPTRQQEKAADNLVRTLGLVAESARLDGRSTFGLAELRELARLVAKASSAFNLETIVERAVEERGRSLGLRGGTAELLALVAEGTDLLSTLLLSDDEFRAKVEETEAELGEF